MARLIMTDSSGREQGYEVGTQPKVFGRGEDSDVVLGSRSVARHHMRIWEEHGKVMVEDLTEGQGIRLESGAVTGTFELPPGEKMEAGVFSFRLVGVKADDEVPEALPEQTRPVPVLEGVRGPTKGLEIQLRKGENDIGRDPSSYLAIEHSSVSRMHARLTVHDGHFELVDMRSSNGTFVNNQRVESMMLQSGDFIRFGSLEFRFRYGPAVSKEAAALKRKRLLLVGAVSTVAVVLMVGIYAKLSSRGKKTRLIQDTETQEEIPLEVRIEQHLKAAQGLMENLDWKQAQKEVDRALELHPISAEAKKQKKLIKEELANKIIYDDAMVDYDLSKWDEALALFRRIPLASAYHKKIKYKISEIESKLADFHLKEGRSFFKAQDYTKAHRHFIAYMELRPCDQQLYQKWIKTTEAKMRHYDVKHTPFAYNCAEEKTAPALDDAKKKLDPEEVLRAEYPQEKIYQALLLYFRGKAEMAIQELRRIKALSNDSGLVEKASELERYLMVINGKYNQGTALLFRGELGEARRNFQVALENDVRIVPPGLRSFYREDIGSKLADRLYKEGREEYARGQYENAFDFWKECLVTQPDDTTCMGGLQELEQLANEALEEARELERRGDRKALDFWKRVMKITRPESLPYKNSNQKLMEYQK